MGESVKELLLAPSSVVILETRQSVGGRGKKGKNIDDIFLETGQKVVVKNG